MQGPDVSSQLNFLQGGVIPVRSPPVIFLLRFWFCFQSGEVLVNRPGKPLAPTQYFVTAKVRLHFGGLHTESQKITEYPE